MLRCASTHSHTRARVEHPIRPGRTKAIAKCVLEMRFYPDHISLFSFESSCTQMSMPSPCLPLHSDLWHLTFSRKSDFVPSQRKRLGHLIFEGHRRVSHTSTMGLFCSIQAFGDGMQPPPSLSRACLLRKASHLHNLATAGGPDDACHATVTDPHSSSTGDQFGWATSVLRAITSRGLVWSLRM